MGHAEAIQTRVLDFQRYHCLSAWASEGFFPGGATRGFSKIFPGGAKSSEIWLFPVEIKKTSFFCLNFQNPRGPRLLLPLPSDAHACLSVAKILTKSRLLTLKTNLATCCQKSSHYQYFFHTLFEAWVMSCSPKSDLGRAKKVWLKSFFKSISV